MKKIAIKIFIVLLSIVIIDYFIGFFYDSLYFNEKSGEHFRTTFTMEQANADVLVLGSSKANHHYVPKVFQEAGLSFYNGGQDGTGIFHHLAAFRVIIKRYKPKILILDYNGPFTFNQMDYDKLSILNPYYNKYDEIKTIVNLKSDFERLKLKSNMYRYNSQLLTIVNGHRNSIAKERKDDNGYLPLYGTWNYPLEDAIEEERQIDYNKVSALDEIIKTCKKEGVEIYVIGSPTFLKFNKKLEINLCDSICKSNQIKYYDFVNDSIFINNNKLFYDLSHLNDSGAVIFSEIVLNKVLRKNQN